jgi:predicted metal-dependent hydrolase
LNEVEFKGQKIKYILVIKNVKNMNLRIKPDQTVNVSANNMIPLNIIENFIFSKGDYILKALQKYVELEKYSPKPKQYISGESFRILGRDLRLKVIQAKAESIESDGIFLNVYVKETANLSKKKSIVDKWILSQCSSIFNEICCEVFSIFKKYDVAYPKIQIRDMISRWGSCQPKREIITLNKRLIEAPRNCIEYVVLHEFAHFIHPNHSKKFYSFVAMLMPDYKERKRVLEGREYYLSDL